jgi:RsmE family RNA methyltransferase
VNLILLYPEDFVSEDLVRLEGRRLRHVTDVHKASLGDELRVGLLNGDVGTGSVTALDDRALEMRVRLYEPPPDALPVTLVLALPRPKVLRRVLSSVSSLGVKRIFLINALRVEKSYWQSPVLNPEALRKQLTLGLEQARDTVLPEMLLRPRFRPFVEDELPGIILGNTALLAHPGAPEPFPPRIDSASTVVVGPEGGFIPYEVQMLLSCGFRAVHVGRRILSVETAVPFILSRMSQEHDG